MLVVAASRLYKIGITVVKKVGEISIDDLKNTSWDEIEE